jgi:hypothetical protein
LALTGWLWRRGGMVLECLGERDAVSEMRYGKP